MLYWFCTISVYADNRRGVIEAVKEVFRDNGAQETDLERWTESTTPIFLLRTGTEWEPDDFFKEVVEAAKGVESGASPHLSIVDIEDVPWMEYPDGHDEDDDWPEHTGG